MRRRADQIDKQKEQLIQEMELAVYRRETIVNKAKIAVKTNKANNTQMALQKEAGLHCNDEFLLSYHIFASFTTRSDACQVQDLQRKIRQSLADTQTTQAEIERINSDKMALQQQFSDNQIGVCSNISPPYFFVVHCAFTVVLPHHRASAAPGGVAGT